ncbi:MAG: carbon storage regulator [Gammaproteobacteria bacterium]|nr:carbon storage regulator [Gammaproteobacteria bacterium]
MLVPERKQGESIVINNGDDIIVIKVDNDNKGAVKLVFDAPLNYVILRKELIKDDSVCSIYTLRQINISSHHISLSIVINNRINDH